MKLSFDINKKNFDIQSNITLIFSRCTHAFIITKFCPFELLQAKCSYCFWDVRSPLSILFYYFFLFKKMFVKLTSLDQSNGILLKYQSIPLRYKKIYGYFSYVHLVIRKHWCFKIDSFDYDIQVHLIEILFVWTSNFGEQTLKFDL